MKATEVIGWIGAALILLAYTLLTFGVVSVASVSFHLLNAIGASGVVYVSWMHKAYPPAVLNVVWVVVAIVGIIGVIA